MIPKRLILIVLVVFLPLGFLPAGVGEVVYWEGGYGDVEVIRNGESVVEDVDYGFVFENFDMIKTSSAGMVQIQTYGSTGINSVITVNGGSSFILELSEIPSEQKAGVRMLAGSLSFKVDRLSGNSGFEVHTESAVMGVRGTNFTVDSTPGGEILVSCREGKVECTDEDSSSFFAQPGFVVQKLSLEEDARNFTQEAVNPAAIDQYRNQWKQSRLELFRSQGSRAMANYARRYVALRDEFSLAYRELMQQRAVLDKWRSEDRQNRMGSTRDILREKKELIQAIKRVRIVTVRLEPIFFRLEELYSYYQEGVGRGTWPGGLRGETFFAQFEQDRGDFERRFATLRHIYKMYARRNGGTVPMTDSSFSSSDDGFISGDEFF